MDVIGNWNKSITGVSVVDTRISANVITIIIKKDEWCDNRGSRYDNNNENICNIDNECCWNNYNDNDNIIKISATPKIVTITETATSVI